MTRRYKLIISNANIYREIELSSHMDMLSIGTSTESDVRLRKDLYFGAIEIVLKNINDEWGIFCSDNLYFTSGSAKKMLTKRLCHGDELYVKYAESNQDVFSLTFMIDFEYAKKDYDTVLDLAEKNQIKIGGSNDCDIFIKDDYLGKDSFYLIRSANGFYIKDNASTYGVFVNGARINEKKSLNNLDFFSIVGYSFFYKNNKLYTTAGKNVDFKNLQLNKTDNISTNFVYPKFNRNTRIQYVVPEEELKIQNAVAKPAKPKKNIVLALIPSIVMLALTIVLRGIIGGGGTFVIYSAVSMGLGIIMTIVTFIEENKNYKAEYNKRIDSYNQYIEEKEEKIQASRDNELRIRKLIYESLENSIDEVNGFGKRIFEKSPEDKDFLHIYLGKGCIESSNPVEYTKLEFVDTEDPLELIPEQISEKYRYIENAPIISDFNTSNGIGIVGTQNALVDILKNITLDLAIRHFYNEVKTVYILNDDYVSKLEWIRWLQNVNNEELDINNIVCDEESKNIIIEELYAILSEREMMKDELKQSAFDEQYVVFVTDSSSIITHPVAKYIKNGSAFGFTFVFLEEYEENLPQGCTEIIRVKENHIGEVLRSENGDGILSFNYPKVSDSTAEDIAKRLGAIQIDEISLEGELTKNISMYDMLDILSVEDLDLDKRWGSSTVYKSLAAPVGVKNKNHTVYLDISDKAGAHGPHGLVAGTTGSGKSEVLQTYILSMATLFHPYEVGFVIIDFKGGGMANQFKELPHLIGTITNIDGREINRSLLSIKAELIKRQEIFSKNGVNHINDYIKLYKENKVSEPLPHLIMIVDEFAELKSEYPDFMKELVSAARIGRTLGIHLILATQKPAGVVDAQIWSNSKFRICLKVQTKEDSNEVLKTPLAAEIVEPGRGYFQVGNNEIFDLFQSAYSGANILEGNTNDERTFSIYERNIWGKKTLKYSNKKKKSDNNSITQLQAIVEYVHEYCQQHNISRLPGICLPSLKDKINTNELVYHKEELGISVPIGIYDDPEQQKQEQLELDFTKNNTYIVGSAQSGKTVLLQTLIYGLMKKYTPEQLNLYLVDCGSMVLKIFEDSAHVGGVVLSNEEEKCKNLFKLLHSMIVQRKKMLVNKNVGNYLAYLDAGYKDMPLAVVVIDNMAAFKEYFPNQYDEINSLTREALGVGISFVITAAASNALNYRTLTNFGEKLALNCNDSSEYGSVFGHCRVTPKDVAGRGLYMHEKRILEYQTAIFGTSAKEAERSNELKEYIIERNKECVSSAIKIPMVPEKLNLKEIMSSDPTLFRKKGFLPIGMNFSTVEMSFLNLNSEGSLLLMGDTDSRDTFVKNFVTTISKTIVFHDIEAYVVDDKNRKLRESDTFGFVKKYTSDVSDGLDIVDDYCDEVLNRQDEDNDDYMMLVLNNVDVFRKICADKRLSKQFAEAIKNPAECRCFILIACGENQSVGFSASEVLKTLKDERKAILFAQLTDSKMFDISGRVKNDTSFDNSMGYYFNGSSYSKIKIFD